MFVIDASVAASWCFSDESHPDADLALARIASETAVAPVLLWFELRNVLLTGEKRRRLTPAQTARFLYLRRDLPIETDQNVDGGVALALARTHGLSFYDAVYLEVAQRRALPLATLDEALKRASRAEKVGMIGTA